MDNPSSLALAPIRTEAQALEAVKVMSNIVLALRRDVLQKDVDYGVIPGTGDKPTLLLPGMEKLMRALNAVPEYIEKCVIRDYDRPLFHYEYECRLIEADTGLAIPGGRGIGLCTSFESAFRYRKAERVCPKCGKPTVYKSKDKPEWYCWRKKDGCGATFPENDTQITSQQVGRIENPDIFDQVNAIMKRAKKRALGDAVKGAASVSEFFTVDLEEFARFDDVVEGQFVEVEPPKAAPQPEPQAEKPATPKNAPAAPQGYSIGDLYNAVLKDVYGGNSFHMTGSIKKLIEAGKLPNTLTLEQAIEVVKANRAEKDASDQLPRNKPPSVSAAEKPTPAETDKAVFDPNPHSEAEARAAELARLENEEAQLYEVQKLDYVRGKGLMQGWKWLAKATVFGSNDKDERVDITLFPEDVQAIKDVGHHFPQTDGPVSIPVIIHIEDYRIRINREKQPKKQANPFGGKPADNSQQLYDALPSANDKTVQATLGGMPAVQQPV